ncbi:MAG: hypothetical protein FJ387_02290 [Verrucomicrobia bacterium]|nr:hypothetical protein [Verrucomicrobiota bacterium]
MTQRELRELEELVKGFLSGLRKQALKADHTVHRWQHTLLDENLFASTMGAVEGATGKRGETKLDVEERAVAMSLILLGHSVAALGADAWANPLRTAPLSPMMVAELRAGLRRHIVSANLRRRCLPQGVVACLLGWRHSKWERVPDDWRQAARHLVEFVVRTVMRARIQWLQQLDCHLQKFNEHPTLIGQHRDIVGEDRVARRVLSHLLDEPPCQHWVLSSGIPSAPQIERRIACKTNSIEAEIAEVEFVLGQARRAGDEAATQDLAQTLGRLQGQLQRGNYLANAERAFLTCRRTHTIQGWDPQELAEAAPAARGPTEEDPVDEERPADLWGFIARAVSGMASPFKFVVSAACTAHTEPENRNRIFGHWEQYAQPFAGSLFFHALNAARDTLRWANAVHWQCPETLCRRWCTDACRRPPSDLACGFASRPEEKTILKPRFVRTDYIGSTPRPLATVKVWVCHTTHEVSAPRAGPRLGEPPQMDLKRARVVYALRHGVCPWCRKPHSRRPAKALVVRDHMASIT